MLAVPKDEHSLGYYRRVADEVAPSRIFEVLSVARQTTREGHIRKSRGAMFVDLIKRRDEADALTQSHSSETRTGRLRRVEPL